MKTITDGRGNPIKVNDVLLPEFGLYGHGGAVRVTEISDGVATCVSNHSCPHMPPFKIDADSMARSNWVSVARQLRGATE